MKLTVVVDRVTSTFIRPVVGPEGDCVVTGTLVRCGGRSALRLLQDQSAVAVFYQAICEELGHSPGPGLPHGEAGHMGFADEGLLFETTTGRFLLRASMGSHV